jgi:hypothetical protein
VSVEITEPGVYDGLSDVDYHADPVPGGSLSSTGARRLLPPSCPAKYRWLADHPDLTTRALELGAAAHHLVLGVGRPIHAVDYDNYRTKDAQVAAKSIRAAGGIPLLAHEYQQVEDMAAQLLDHPVAGPLLRLPGAAEQSLFWVDPEFGVWRRVRLDWYPKYSGTGRLIIPEYKTSRSAERKAAGKAMAEYGYYMQCAWQQDAVTALGVCGDQPPASLLVFQEKDPPYLVEVYEPEPVDLALGQARNRQALEVFRRCRDTGVWPGYSNGQVQLLSLPRWAAHELEDTL